MAKQLFELDRLHPQIMAILNVTPDSFSDGGCCYSGEKIDLDLCCRRVESMLVEGATIIDIGGESTRPGASHVSVQQEMDRVLPVIEAVSQFDVVISLDTSSPEVIEESMKFGIGMINDVRALQRGNALSVAVRSGLPVCLMHMQGDPASMQENPVYKNVLESIEDFFSMRIKACLDAGMKKENIIIDPGFGFGKTLEHNRLIMEKLSCLKKFGLPLLVGLSRKSMISSMLGSRAIHERMAGSIALAVLAVERGAWIVRAHDIKETVDAVNIAKIIIGKNYV